MSVRRLAPPEQQPKSFAFSADNLAWAKKQVAKYPEGRQQSAIIPLLWRAQEQAGGDGHAGSRRPVDGACGRHARGRPLRCLRADGPPRECGQPDRGGGQGELSGPVPESRRGGPEASRE